MPYFIPPYPERHKKALSPAQTLYHARKDLLSIWTEDAFNYQFMSIKMFNQNLFVANHPELVRRVFVEKNKHYERKSPMMRKALDFLLGDGLFISDGKTWESRRKLQTPLFNTQHVIQYSEIMTKTTQELCQTWESKASTIIEVLPEMAKLTAEIICRCLFGNELGTQKATEVVDAFTEYQDAIEQMDLSTFLGIPDWLPVPGMNMRKAKKAAKRIHKVVDEIIDETAKNDIPQASLLAMFLEAATDEKHDKLTLVQIRNELIVLFMAGHETTANTLAWAWYLISQSPDTEKQIHEEISRVVGNESPCYTHYDKLTYTRAVLDETMRLYPPVPILSRHSSPTESDMIRDRLIPPNSMMIVIPWLLHRHKQYWDEPDAFIPERFLPNAPRKVDKFAYVPFSIGPRVCLGKYFGQVELVMTLATIASKYRLTLPPNTPVKHECRLTLRPEKKLPMYLEKRCKKP
jgi:cytochrome P450